MNQNVLDPLKGVLEKDVKEIMVGLIASLCLCAWNIPREARVLESRFCVFKKKIELGASHATRSGCPKYDVRNYSLLTWRLSFGLQKHRKKLEGRRLDYDFKRRKMPTSQGKITDADIKISEQKMDESKALYECGMLHLLENDVEQVGQLAAFVEATLNMQRQSVDIMENVLRNLRSKYVSPFVLGKIAKSDKEHM